MDLSFPGSHGYLYVQWSDQRLRWALLRVGRLDGVWEPHKVLAVVPAEGSQWSGRLGRRSC